MNRIRPLIYGSKNDDVPDCYNRVRYIRDSCKVFSDLWKNEKDFLNKSIESELCKSFKDFRQSEVARNYRSSTSILNQTIDQFIEINEFIELKRKESAEQIKKLLEQARDKQTNIRQTMNDLRDNYEKAQRKLETADTNLKKFQTRSDRLSLANFDDRCRELEEIRCECEQTRSLARDHYACETYQYASEESSLTRSLFVQYLHEQNLFHEQIHSFFSTRLPQLESQLNSNPSSPPFGEDLLVHCSKRSNNHSIAYPIEICVHLLEHSLQEEGLFRITPSHLKQKKFVAELNLQLIDKGTTLEELNLDCHVPASTLKQYLRELPNCLLTNQLFQQWNQVATLSDETTRVQRISELLDRLPPVHYENLCYLVRFFSSVVDHSSENKMTANNLAICIGCSLLYPKDPSSTTTPLSNSYTNGSILFETFVNHHRQLFPLVSSTTTTTTNEEKSSRIRPDLIPTDFHPSRSEEKKSRSNSKENYLEVVTPLPSMIAQPSPSARRKAKAPAPPPSSSSRSSEISGVGGGEEMLGEGLTPFPSSSTVNEDRHVHRRTGSGGGLIDRPGAPPPLPPPSSRYSASPSHLSDEQLSEEKRSVSVVETSNVGKVIAEFNHRMSTNKSPQSTLTSTRRLSSSSMRNPLQQSPGGETTDF